MKKTSLIIIFSIISNVILAQVDNENSANLGIGQLTKNDSISMLLMLRNANFLPDSIIHSVDSFLIFTLGKDSFENAISKTRVTVWEYNNNGEVIGGSLYNNGKPKKPKNITLLDSTTNYKFVLEKDYIFITAYDDKKKILWKTDPYLDNRIHFYRTKRPRIIQFRFGKSPGYFPEKIKPGITVIWVTYNNTQYGFIDLKTGAYYLCGQD